MRTEYYTNLHSNPYITLRWLLPLIKKSVATGQGITTTKPVPIKGLGYTLYLTPVVITDEYGRIVLTLKWEDDGEELDQQIIILQEESNLVSGSPVYYFLSYGNRGRNEYKCRKLFYIGSRWRDRRSFRHKYSSQNKSHQQRNFNDLPEPYRKYGKESYRGKLTPYGKRCIRYEGKEDRELEALEKFLGRIRKRVGKRI